MSSLIICSVILTIVHSQTSIASQYYFIDVYDLYGVTISGNSVPSISVGTTNAYIDPSNKPFLAFPLNICTRRSDDISGDNQYMIWDCATDAGIWRCGSGNLLCPDMTCDGLGNDQNVKSGFVYTNQATNEYGGGVCDTNDYANTQTRNYMKVDYYTQILNESPDGCPGVERGDVPSNPNVGFTLQATDTFATNICVKQTGNTYIMITCDLNGGYINEYSNPSCSTQSLTRNLLTYNFRCGYFQHPNPTTNDQRWFRRYAGCYVNDVNIILPTESPTPEPTNEPTKTPTKAPTTPIPSKSPSISPTGRPSIPPTKNPSTSPTIPAPSTSPTLKPSKNPTTDRPTRSPVDYTQSPTPAPTPAPTDKDDLEGLKKKASNLTYIEIGVIAAALLCIIIGCALFCKCQKNRAAKAGTSRAKQRNAQRRLELQHRKQQQQQAFRQQQQQQQFRQQRGQTHQVVRQISPSAQSHEPQRFTVI